MIENNPFPEIERRGLLIEIMGLPASGKSTFANFLGERLGFRVLGEIPVERVPNFENYYKRRGDKHLALATQLVFLYESWLQNGGSEPLAIPGVKDILKDGPVILEPPFWQNTLYAQTRLEGKPKLLALYNRVASGLIQKDAFPKPDYLIYLRVSFSSMLKRIKERAKNCPQRKVELKEKRKYWKRLWILHEEWITQNPLGLNIIVLNMDKFDPSVYKDEREAMEAMLAEFSRESGVPIK